MKAYIYKAQDTGLIHAICKTYGIKIATKQGVSLEIDLFIIDITKPTATVRFLLAHALLQNKKTLCLYSKHNQPYHLIAMIKKQSQHHFVTITPYTAENLENKIIQFVSNLH